MEGTEFPIAPPSRRALLPHLFLGFTQNLFRCLAGALEAPLSYAGMHGCLANSATVKGTYLISLNTAAVKADGF